MNVIAICSMLGEPHGLNSVSRRFRDEPVLRHTLRRLRRVASLQTIVVSHWDDQAADCALIDGATLFSAGPRGSRPRQDSVDAAQRWSDGWRGGLLSTAACDRGFDAGIVRQIVIDHAADAVVLIDPAAAMVDPDALSALIAAATGDKNFYFNHMPPGLGGVLCKRALLEQLAAQQSHAGRLLHYTPDAPVLDPVLSDACVSPSLRVSRAVGSYLLGSHRQIERFETATAPLNGTLAASGAEAIVRHAEAASHPAAAPRDLTIELTTRRNSAPIYSPLAAGPVDRPDLSAEVAAAVAPQVAACDDLRVTLAGVGDPLCHPDFARIVRLLGAAHALHVETDLIELSDDALAALVGPNVDVVTVHLPAMRPATYAAVMAVDAMPRALANLERLLRARQAAGRGTPLVVPTLAKTGHNFDEIEQWYDTWLRALGSAVITGPATFCGRIADTGVADMTPPLRQPCRRIESRMTLLSDGRYVACEQDAGGTLGLGAAGAVSLADAWQAIEKLRAAHRDGALPPACARCKEWHRP